MTKLISGIAITSALLSTTAFANTRDVLSCYSSTWDATVGINSIPDETDTVNVSVNDKIDSSEEYTANIKKGTFAQTLEQGLNLLNTEDPSDHARLVVHGKKATFTFQGQVVDLVCEDTPN